MGAPKSHRPTRGDVAGVVYHGASPASNLEDVGAQECMGAPYAARLMRLNFLAPDIVVAILNGRQPVNLTARKLMTDTRLPFVWPEQRVALGFIA
jgi:site-specific DNA recombinase